MKSLEFYIVSFLIYVCLTYLLFQSINSIINKLQISTICSNIHILLKYSFKAIHHILELSYIANKTIFCYSLTLS